MEGRALSLELTQAKPSVPLKPAVPQGPSPAAAPMVGVASPPGDSNWRERVVHASADACIRAACVRANPESISLKSASRSSPRRASSICGSA
jgi:hypothetical protein